MAQNCKRLWALLAAIEKKENRTMVTADALNKVAGVKVYPRQT
jgi:hypothetical protein